MRIAVLDRDRCKPDQCGGFLCARVCPVNRSGSDPAIKTDEKYPVFVEELCIGCGICVKKCPFGAITIVNTPEEGETPTHQYGVNGFRIYGLPYPKHGGVVGIIGRNGTGKSTALAILSGELVPNFGKEEASRGEVVERFKGTELQAYFTELYAGKIRTSVKPQEIEKIPNFFSGKVRDLLKNIGDPESIAERFGFSHLLDRDVRHLSGGELQLVAIAAAASKDAEFLFVDEPSSYLDIRQRMRVAAEIHREAERKRVMVVEHDLAVLDYISDHVFIVYGIPGAYGVFSGIKGVLEGINQFLEGYLREENVRFRDEPLHVETRPPSEWSGKPLFTYPSLRKTLGGFTLSAEGGEVREGEIVGLVGPNGIGKTTFVRMLAGEIEPDEGEVGEASISYKPQYISFPDMPVHELFTDVNHEVLSEIRRPLELDRIWEKNAVHLSGGEKQRVAVALCLATDADVYLLDEPSAFLDVDQRIACARVIKRVISGRKKAGFVVDHDILFVDYVSDRLVVFSGEPGREGHASAPLSMRDGMNRFLKDLGITFRRDPATGRPRVNKIGSQKDMEQKRKGEYYYM